MYFISEENKLIKMKKDTSVKDASLTAREERLELPTPGFGDQCSTN